MAKNQNPARQTSIKAKFIFNPHAGTKRKLLPNPNSATTSLEDIKDLLKKYQIPVDYCPTKAPGHATELSKSAQKEGYKLVLVAGGDGTVGEAVNGLVGSDIPLGIIPLGSFMNIARMLSIPLDIEKAVMLVKIGRSRKIDVGSVTQLSGEKLSEPYYFLESCGLGIEAELHQYFLDLERGNYKAIFKTFKTLFAYYGYPAKLTLDNEKVETRAILINVANGPYSGAALKLAPKAKLNDHKLTITQLKLSKIELFKYLFRLATGRKKGYYHKAIINQAKKVKIETRVARPVHADARLYGVTPVEFKIVPNALNIISGFPESKSETSLIKRTLLDP
jgi:diacylglycerol kinase (ATP)